MTQNKLIAVTGGIGSGKTSFCDTLRELGYPVFSCDEISHELWQDANYLAGLAARFPQCTEGGIVQKELLSALVFSDEDALRNLNEYAHPRIMETLLSRMRAHPVAIAEVPLLFEGGFEDLFGIVVIVTRERGARLDAVARRDGLTEGEIEARMRAQTERAAPKGEKFIVVENDGTLAELRQKAAQLVRRLGI